MQLVENFEYKEINGFKFGRSVFGKPKLAVHIYFIDGLLIDTGQSRMRKWVLKKTEKLNIEQIFITHHHEDHSGNIREIQKIHNCPVYASKLSAEIMKAPPQISFAQKMTWGDRAAYYDIIPKEDKIETANYCFEPIPIPGHAVDMQALYEPNKKWLFSADLYINSYIGYFLKNESIAEQINSLKKILDLELDEVFCSHKARLKQPKQQLKRKLDFLESFNAKVSTLYETGMTAEKIMKALKLKENWLVRISSAGDLSTLNMIKSAILDIDKRK